MDDVLKLLSNLKELERRAKMYSDAADRSAAERAKLTKVRDIERALKKAKATEAEAEDILVRAKADASAVRSAADAYSREQMAYAEEAKRQADVMKAEAAKIKAASDKVLAANNSEKAALSKQREVMDREQAAWNARKAALEDALG